MSFVEIEIDSQPECWHRAYQMMSGTTDLLPAPGQRVAVVGCGTSWFMAIAYAALRERAGQGDTSAHPASEFPRHHGFDRVLVLTRSGTTTEVLDLLATLPADVPATVVTAVADSPAARATDAVIALPFADERSVVQTRFATTALALLRAHLGQDLTGAVADARAALAGVPPLDAATLEQVTFLGTGWTVGLAHEAALKCREAAQFWTEAYPAMEYRHGPIAIAGPGRAVWAFGRVPAGLADEVAATGARFVHDPGSDPMADLIRAQRLAVGLARQRGLDPDRPRHLSRSVILSPPAS